MGVMVILSDIMTREDEKQRSMHAWTEINESITLPLIISEFFPAIDDPYYDITSNSNEILCKGPSQLDTSNKEIETWFEIVYSKLFKICQTTHCPTSYKILMLKTICNACEDLSHLVNIGEHLNYRI